jgi:uncharacterized protein YaaR (DUF327 family)
MALAPVQNTTAINALMSIQQSNAEASAEAGAALKGAAVKTATSEEPKLNFFEQFKLGIRQTTDTKPSVEQLEQRAADIRRMGAFLQKHPLPEMVKDYITQVRGLLADINDQAYSANKRDGLFQKLDVVNEKLDALADKVLSDEKDGLELAQSLGELNGLLIDIFV